MSQLLGWPIGSNAWYTVVYIRTYVCVHVRVHTYCKILIQKSCDSRAISGISLGELSHTHSSRCASGLFLSKSYNLETFIRSAVNLFVHPILKRSKKYLMQKVGRFGFPGWIPMIQPPFLALELLYNMRLERKFSIELFLSYTAPKIRISAQLHAVF